MGERHIIVKFGPGIPSDAQGRSLLAMEKLLREDGIEAEVFKETAPDDSKLRLSLQTKEARDKL